MAEQRIRASALFLFLHTTMQQPITVKFTITAKRTLKAIQDGFPIIVNEGGARCFHADQKVITDNGPVAISQLQEGSKVLSTNGEYQPVYRVFKTENKKPSVKVKLKNGQEIICTEDHLFYFSGRWVELKEILSLIPCTK